jgi:di/tricarboxylate transporter
MGGSTTVGWRGSARMARAGFIKWFASFVAAHVGGLPPGLMIMLLVAVYSCRTTCSRA